jgi:hypothetical protein
MSQRVLRTAEWATLKREVIRQEVTKQFFFNIIHPVVCR